MKSDHALRTTAFACLLVTIAPFSSWAQSSIEGHWDGSIATPGTALVIDIDLEVSADGSLTGDISIPAQGARDVPLIELSHQGESVRFQIEGIPGTPTFDGVLSEDGARLSGRFRQGGAELDFELARSEHPAARARAALVGFDALVERGLEDFNVPGLGIGVVAGGELVYAEGFGHRDLKEQLPVTKDTLFAIGSTTKAMTATVLGMLVDDGLVDWNAPVRSYLPSFRLMDTTVTERLTVRDLVTHRSGLPRHDLLWYNFNEGSREELIARFEHLELTQDLRAKFQYNNLMFMTAGYLAGHVADSNWEDLVRGRLFRPLGMERTNFSVLTSKTDANYALPYREDDEQRLEAIPFRRIDLIGPAGSVNSSIEEMSRWLLFNLQGGKAGDEQLVSAATLADIHAPHMTTGAGSTRPDISQATYGLGWSIDTYRGHRRVRHGGGIDGFITSVMLFPDDGVGLVAFNNRGSGLPALINQHAADRVLGLEPVDWIAEAAERRKKGIEAQEAANEKKQATRIADTVPSHSLADYAGVYQHPGYGSLTVKHESDALSVVINGIEAPLVHWHYDVWNGAETDGDPTFQDTKFQFRGDLDGQIASVEALLEPTASPIAFAREPDAQLSDPAYLGRFVGTYRTVTGTEIQIELTGEMLAATIPGQPRYTLEPTLSGRFALKEVRLISIGFELSESGEVEKAILYQPNGVFDAEKIE